MQKHVTITHLSPKLREIKPKEIEEQTDTTIFLNCNTFALCLSFFFYYNEQFLPSTIFRQKENPKKFRTKKTKYNNTLTISFCINSKAIALAFITH